MINLREIRSLSPSERLQKFEEILLRHPNILCSREWYCMDERAPENMPAATGIVSTEALKFTDAPSQVHITPDSALI